MAFNRYKQEMRLPFKLCLYQCVRSVAKLRYTNMLLILLLLLAYYYDKCLHGAAPSYPTEMCAPAAASTGRRGLRSAARWDLMDGAQNENENVWIMELCSLQTTCLEWSATDFAFIIHYTWTVSEQTKDNTISLGLWDVTCRFHDCLGR